MEVDRLGRVEPGDRFGQRRTLRLAFISPFLDDLVAPAVREFQQRHPNARVSLFDLPPRAQLDRHQEWEDRLIAARYGESFPMGTLAVNVSGSLVIGFLAALSAREAEDRRASSTPTAEEQALAAKRKAAKRLGATDSQSLPGNEEIEAALRSYQALYQEDEQRERIQEMRAVALDAMQALAEFRPYLAGPVLRGTAARYGDIDLHLFTDDEKGVEIYLINEGI